MVIVDVITLVIVALHVHGNDTRILDLDVIALVIVALHVHGNDTVMLIGSPGTDQDIADTPRLNIGSPLTT